MALRLTDSASSRRPDPKRRPAPAPATPPAVLLQARAEACLAQRDLAGYRALFDEASKVDDVHRRYEARKRLLEVGLTTKGGSIAAVAPALAVVAAAATDVLEIEPREPTLLTYAGVAFYELGELNAAEQLFKAARRLDPEIAHVDGNLDEIARRRRIGLSSVKLPGALGIKLKELATRATAVAAKAQPATGLTVSLCMIVKDEESMLGRTLAAVADHVDEIVVVDTGSTDKTVAIAEEFGAKVLHHPWTGDFSEARNVSLNAATGDWLIYLDADEVLVEADGPLLKSLAGHTWREAFYLVETNHTGDLEDGTAVQHNALRMFRNRPEYRFEGRLHEQYAHKLPGFLPERLEQSAVRVDHYGYLGVVRDGKGKSQRNIELITKQIAETDNPSAFLHFNLGTELAVAGERHAALEEFKTAWAKLPHEGNIQKLGYAPSLAARLVRTLRACGQLDEAMKTGDEVLEHFPGFTDIVLEQSAIARDKGDVETAETLLHRCLEMGDAPSRYTPMLGAGTYFALIQLADLLKVNGRRDEAEAVVAECLAKHPRFIGVVEPYASIRLANGADAADVVAEIQAALPELTTGARFMLAVALHEHGAVAEAEAELRAVVEAQPQSAPPRLALAEALLSQAKFAEAAAVCAPVGQDSPLAGAAARTRVFAALADGDPQTAQAVLEDAPLPDAEKQALGAWRMALAGETPPEILPAEAADTLTVMLEALARIEAFDAFEQLVGRFETIDLPWREKREKLANVYLRRGFLDSAADEWISVCHEEGADAPAMIGLAQVAYAKGLDEDAIAFAEEAHALDPSDPATGLLVERLIAATA